MEGEGRGSRRGKRRKLISQTGWYSIYLPFKGGGLSKPRPRVETASPSSLIATHLVLLGATSLKKPQLGSIVSNRIGM